MTETERVAQPDPPDATEAEWTHEAHLRTGLWHVLQLPMRYCSEGQLFSVVARRSWVEPDLRSID